MRILLLAPDYLNLYKYIESELTSNGHIVVCLKDKILPFDSYHTPYTFKKRLKGMYNELQGKYEKYWDELFYLNEELLEPFDLLFVINGCSFHYHLLELLRKINSKIRSSLYLWDTCKYYDYMRNVRFFDVVKTFDLDDSNIIGKDSFLPFFWIPSLVNKDKIVWDVFSIGSHHDGRYEIFRKIKNQCDELGLKANLKIYVELIKETESIRRNIIKANKKNDFATLTDINISLGKKNDEIITYQRMLIDEVNENIIKSSCIVDTDRDTQTGTTPRVIWALAYGKKIISTNENLIRMPFYNKNQIMIISRNNPFLDKEFIIKGGEFERAPFIDQLRIDRWIKNFI